MARVDLTLAQMKAESDVRELARLFFGVGLVITMIVTVYVTRVARKALKEAELEGGAEEPA